MSVQFDSTPPTAGDYTNVALTLGAAPLGGAIGVRVIVDDSVVATKEQAVVALRAVVEALIRLTWPVS